MMKQLVDPYVLIHQLEYLLLIEGYHKQELAHLLNTTVTEINHCMLCPDITNDAKPWMQEVAFLFQMNKSAATYSGHINE